MYDKFLTKEIDIHAAFLFPELEITAAKNPDGTIVLVVMNTSEEDKMVNLRMNGTTTRLTFWGNSIATVLI